MNKALIIGIAVVIVLAAVLFFLSTRNQETAPEPPPPPTSAEAEATSPKEITKEVIIEITAKGFSPSSITIPRGASVRFINKDANQHWPASGVHPVHQVCPGFDALRPLSPGESYSFSFIETKTCPMHDHLNPSLRGSIVVE